MQGGFDSQLISAHTIYVIELISTTRTSSAPAAAYFARWIDHASWNEWDHDTESVTIFGPAQVGTRGVLRPKGGPRVKFTIAECVQDRVYTDVSRLPGATLTFRHTASPAGEGSRLGVDVTLEGPLARVWAKTVFREFGTGVQAGLDRLIAIEEAK